MIEFVKCLGPLSYSFSTVRCYAKWKQFSWVNIFKYISWSNGPAQNVSFWFAKWSNSEFVRSEVVWLNSKFFKKWFLRLFLKNCNEHNIGETWLNTNWSKMSVSFRWLHIPLHASCSLFQIIVQGSRQRWRVWILKKLFSSKSNLESCKDQSISVSVF